MRSASSRWTEWRRKKLRLQLLDEPARKEKTCCTYEACLDYPASEYDRAKGGSKVDHGSDGGPDSCENSKWPSESGDSSLRNCEPIRTSSPHLDHACLESTRGNQPLSDDTDHDRAEAGLESDESNESDGAPDLYEHSDIRPSELGDDSSLENHEPTSSPSMDHESSGGNQPLPDDIDDDRAEAGSEFENNESDRAPDLFENSDEPSEPGDPSDGEHEDDEDDVDDLDNEEDLNFNFAHPLLNARLECTKEHTARDAILLGLALSVRHSWTYEALIGHFTTQNVLLGIKYLPSSKKQLWRILGRQNAGIVAHGYCKVCRAYLGKRETLNNVINCACGNQISKGKVSYFVTLSLRKQLKNFLALPGMSAQLQYNVGRVKVNPGAIEDLHDGLEYNSLQNIMSSHDYSYVFNTDGFKIMKGSKLSAWPVYIRINELPPNLRQKFLFLAAVWIDSIEPPMNEFLKPFVSQANDLSGRGITWKPDGVNDVCSKFFPTCLSVDSKARCSLLNMTQYNGYNGCTYCDIRGVHEAGNMRFPYLRDPRVPPPVTRTNLNIIEDMITVTETGENLRGVKGPSALMLLNYFGLFTGSASDDLHPFHEGNAAHHTQLLLTSVGNVSCEEKVRIIDSRLSKIQTPSSISRKPMSIKKRGQWKGSEWRNWLFYYGVPCLKDLVPQKHIEIFEILSHSVFLMSQEVIEPNDVLWVERHVELYVQLFEEYYGIRNMFYNVHLLHAPTSVRNWGPLWAYSTYNFESWNHRLMKCITSPKGAIDQLVTRHLISMYVNSAVYHEGLSQEVRSQLETILIKAKRKEAQQLGDVYLLGEEHVRGKSEAEEMVLTREGIQCKELFEYQRILLKGTEFTPAAKVNLTGLSNDSVIYTTDDTFCTILCIVKYVEEGVEKCGLFVTEHDVIPCMRYAKHIVKWTQNHDMLHFLKVDKVKCPALKITVCHESFYVPLANRWEID